MTSTLLVSLAALALPTIVFIFGGWLMMEVSGRGEVIREAKCRSIDLDKMSLSMKWRGYDDRDVKDYWEKLGPNGRSAELRFLKIDLLFALFYSAAFTFSILTLWTALGGKPGPWLILLLVPVFLALFADWVEGYMQITQLRIFEVDGRLGSALIDVASKATVTKIWTFALSSLIVIVLAIALPICGSRSGAEGPVTSETNPPSAQI